MDISRAKNQLSMYVDSKEKILQQISIYKNKISVYNLQKNESLKKQNKVFVNFYKEKISREKYLIKIK